MIPKTVLPCVLVVVLLQTLSPACMARNILVPKQKATIQGGINIAADGDTVLVAPGTYLENIDFKGKAITVRAEKGPLPAIIDGQSKGPVVKFHTGEGAQSILLGFTIQHGMTLGDALCAYDGGGVCILNASPTIQNNTIIDNIAISGSGIAVDVGAPLIEGNYIGNNIADGSGGMGGGIYLYNTTTVRIVDNVIENNTISEGGGIGMFSGGTPTITGNIIRGNYADEGGGIWIVNYSTPYIAQNLIAGNNGGYGSGVYWGVPEGWQGPLVVNNTIAGNGSPNGAPTQAIYADGFDTTARMYNNLVIGEAGRTALYCGDYDNYPPFMSHNDVYSNGGLAYENRCADQTGRRGNISADPAFVDPASADYHLQAGSPAIDSGVNTVKRSGGDFDGMPRIVDGNLDGTATIDLGIYEYRPPGADGSTAATVPRVPRQTARAGDFHPSLRRFDVVGKDNRHTVQYFDGTGRLVAEVDAHGVFHRMP